MQVSYYINQNDYVRQRALMLAVMGGSSIGVAAAAPVLSALSVIVLFITTRCSLRLNRYFKQCQQEVQTLSSKEMAQYRCAVAKRRHRISLALVSVAGVMAGLCAFIIASGGFALGVKLVS